MTTEKNVPAEDERRNQLRADCRELAERLRAAATVALEGADRIAEYASRRDRFDPGPAWGYLEYTEALDRLTAAAVGVEPPGEAIGCERLSSSQHAAAAAAYVLQVAADLNGPGRADSELAAVALDLFRRVHAARPDKMKATPEISVLEVIEDSSRTEGALGPRTDDDLRWLIGVVLEFAQPGVPAPSVEQARAAVDAWNGRGGAKKWDALNDFLRILGLELNSGAALERQWHRCRKKRAPRGETED